MKNKKTGLPRRLQIKYYILTDLMKINEHKTRIPNGLGPRNQTLGKLKAIIFYNIFINTIYAMPIRYT